MLPGGISDLELANNLSIYFANKIDSLVGHFSSLNTIKPIYMPDVPYIELPEFKQIDRAKLNK